MPVQAPVLVTSRPLAWRCSAPSRVSATLPWRSRTWRKPWPSIAMSSLLPVFCSAPCSEPRPSWTAAAPAPLATPWAAPAPVRVYSRSRKATRTRLYPAVFALARSLDSASRRCCCAAMPAAAEYIPSSNGSPKGGSPASALRSSRSHVLSARVVGRRTRGLRRRWTDALGAGADLRRGLLERLVDGLDDLLTGLVGAHRGHHVHHRARGIHAGGLQRSRLVGAGPAAGGRPGEHAVADLARGREGEEAEARRRDAAVGGDADRLAALAEHGVAELVGQRAVAGGLEGAVARVARALRRADGEEAVAGDREVEGLARVLGGRAGEVGDLPRDGRPRADRADGLARAGVLEHDLRERPLRRPVGLVAGRGDVRQVVGQEVLASHLGKHAGGGDVQAAVHLPSSARRERSIFEEAWTSSWSSCARCSASCRSSPAR